MKDLQNFRRKPNWRPMLELS